jgi:cytochrome c biogenesis protein CcdA
MWVIEEAASNNSSRNLRVWPQLTQQHGFAQTRLDNRTLVPMLGLDTVDSVAHVIQVALTPVFLLSGIASLLGVLATRLARVADRVDALADQLETAEPLDSSRLQRRLAYLRRRSYVLDAAVMMGTLGGVATSCAGLLLFVGTLRDRPGVALFVAFGLALIFTMGALLAFLVEMLLASRGLRDQADSADERTVTKSP